jgi:hypothetical protein
VDDRTSRRRMTRVMTAFAVRMTGPECVRMTVENVAQFLTLFSAYLRIAFLTHLQKVSNILIIQANLDWVKIPQCHTHISSYSKTYVGNVIRTVRSTAEPQPK